MRVNLFVLTFVTIVVLRAGAFHQEPGSRNKPALTLLWKLPVTNQSAKTRIVFRWTGRG
jgi:hypothetical protein